VTLAYNTVVVAVGVAAVGFAAGVVGSLGLLRKRPLVADAAAHATLAGVAVAFLATGRRDLAVLLSGALVAAVAAVAVLVAMRRLTRTRDDAATAIVIGVGFGTGVALVSGITARGLPGGSGLAQFLLGHAAALTAGDAALLAAVSAAAVGLVWAGLKEAVLVAFDAEFAAATGWPVAAIDVAIVALLAVMVVVALPAAGAVLVTALVVIPPVAARQWTDRAGPLVLLAGLFGLAAAVVGVAASAAATGRASGAGPALPTGPLVVLAAAAICAVSFLVAPRRGWLARAVEAAADRRRWVAGRLLEECQRAEEAGGTFSQDAVRAAAGGEPRVARAAWRELVRGRAIERVDRAAGRWRLTAAGRARAGDRRARLDRWNDAFAAAPDAARAAVALDLPEPPR
jgi:manganese/zinc/iron transport system permease protein